MPECDSTNANASFLVCRCGAHLCALPLQSVIETMRPLPLKPIADMPPFMLGVSIIRGAIVPVLDAAMLAGASSSAAPARYIHLKAGEHRVCLAVQEVAGVQALSCTSSPAEFPPLLRNINTEIISMITILDGELLLMLQSAHLVPDSVWQAITKSMHVSSLGA